MIQTGRVGLLLIGWATMVPTGGCYGARDANLVAVDAASSVTRDAATSDTSSTNSGAADGGVMGVCSAGAGFHPTPTAVAVGAEEVLEKQLPCTNEPPCVATCGLMGFGHRVCSCVDGFFECETTCVFDDGAHDYACYKLPASAAPMCPPDPTDFSGAMLPGPGSPCTAPRCQPCGSETMTAYRDSTGAPKAGYCVCEGAVWRCAAANLWPPQSR